MAKDKDKSRHAPDPPQPPQTPEPPKGDGTTRTTHVERYITTGSGEPPKTPRTPDPPSRQAATTEEGVPLERTFVRKQTAIFLKQVADHFVLYDPLAHTFLRLNRPALNVWEAIGNDERRFVPHIVARLRQTDPEIDSDDITATLATFIDNGVLTVVTINQE